MKAIVNTGPDRLEWLDWPTPEPGPGQVRVRTAACAICATDLEIITGLNRTGFPMIPGHEWSGFLDAAGPGVDTAWIGRRCVAENVLSDGGELGFEHPGGYAQYLVTEADNVYLLPDAFPAPAAALIEPLAVCVHGLQRLRYEGASPVLIFGDGPIGLLLTALLVRYGASRVAVIGGRRARLARAAALGAWRTVNYHDLSGDLASAVRDAISDAFPIVIEASGSPHAMRAAEVLVDKLGRVLVMGDYRHAQADFRWLDMVHRETELIGSNASAGAWPEAVRLATSGEVPLAELVTHKLPAERFEEGVALMREHSGDVVKVVMEWT